MDITNLAILIAVTLGITEAIKRAVVKDCSRYVPLIALATATLINVFLTRIGATVPQLILNGIIGGLSSVGLFSTTKNTLEGR